MLGQVLILFPQPLIILPQPKIIREIPLDQSLKKGLIIWDNCLHDSMNLTEAWKKLKNILVLATTFKNSIYRLIILLFKIRSLLLVLEILAGSKEVFIQVLVLKKIEPFN
jgi:hypothetical protein